VFTQLLTMAATTAPERTAAVSAPPVMPAAAGAGAGQVVLMVVVGVVGVVASDGAVLGEASVGATGLGVLGVGTPGFGLVMRSESLVLAGGRLSPRVGCFVASPLSGLMPPRLADEVGADVSRVKGIGPAEVLSCPVNVPLVTA